MAEWRGTQIRFGLGGGPVCHQSPLLPVVAKECEVLCVKTSQQSASAKNAACDLGSLTCPTVEANFNYTAASK
jgi:hypothetical protein